MIGRHNSQWDVLYRYIQMDLSLIRLVDEGFNGMFSDTNCGYTGAIGEPVFKQIGGHHFQWDVLRSSL